MVVAIGNRPNPLIAQTSPGLKTSPKHGTLVVDENTLRTSCAGVFAGGDIVLGAATVISAMGQGKLAARSIHEYLTNVAQAEPAPPAEVKTAVQGKAVVMEHVAAAASLALSLQWSPWCPWNLFHRSPQNPFFTEEGAPDIPGICVVGRAEEGGRTFSIVHVQATYNLAQAFARLFAPDSPIYAQLQAGQCFLCWAPVAERKVRDQVLSVIQNWTAAGAPASAMPALIQELVSFRALGRCEEEGARLCKRGSA